MTKEKQEHDLEAKQLRQAIMEYENNLNLMVDEVEKFTALLERKEQEVETWSERVNNLELQRVQEVEQAKRAAEREKHAAVDKEAKEFMNKLNSEKSVFEGKIQETDKKLAELQNTILLLTAEIERITYLYGENQKEVEMWKERYGDLDAMRLAEVEEIREQFDMLKKNSLVRI